MPVLKVGSWYNKILLVKEIFPAFYFVWWYYHVFTNVITYFHLLWQLSKKVSTIKKSIMHERQDFAVVFKLWFRLLHSSLTYCLMGYMAHYIIIACQMLLEFPKLEQIIKKNRVDLIFLNKGFYWVQQRFKTLKSISSFPSANICNFTASRSEKYMFFTNEFTFILGNYLSK